MKTSSEKPPLRFDKAAARNRLEEIYRMKLDTGAEMAETRARADDSSKTKNLESLQRTLDTLVAEEAEVRRLLGGSK